MATQSNHVLPVRSSKEMVYSLVLDSKNKAVEVTISGLITVDRFKCLIDDVDKALVKSNYKRLLYINEGASVAELTTASVKEIAEYSDKLNISLKNGKFASVIDNKLNYGIARMWHAFMSPDIQFDYQLFTRKSNALHWLQMS